MSYKKLEELTSEKNLGIPERRTTYKIVPMQALPNISTAIEILDAGLNVAEGTLSETLTRKECFPVYNML